MHACAILAFAFLLPVPVPIPVPGPAAAASRPVEAIGPPRSAEVSPELAARRRAHRLRRLEREYRRHTSRWVARGDPREASSLHDWLLERAAVLDVDPGGLLPSALRRAVEDAVADRWFRIGLLEFGPPPPPTLAEVSKVLRDLPAYPRNPAAGPFIERCRRLGGATPRLDSGHHPRLARRLRRLMEARGEIEPERAAVETIRTAIRSALARIDPEAAPIAVAVFDALDLDARLRSGWPVRRAKRVLRESLEAAATASAVWRPELRKALAGLAAGATAELTSLHESPGGSVQLEISRISISTRELEAWTALLRAGGPG